jgi:hypothetical protein
MEAPGVLQLKGGDLGHHHVGDRGTAHRLDQRHADVADGDGGAPRADEGVTHLGGDRRLAVGAGDGDQQGTGSGPGLEVAGRQLDLADDLDAVPVGGGVDRMADGDTGAGHDEVGGRDEAVQPVDGRGDHQLDAEERRRRRRPRRHPVVDHGDDGTVGDGSARCGPPRHPETDDQDGAHPAPPWATKSA